MIRIELDTRNIQALKLLEYLRSLPFIHIIDDEKKQAKPKPNKETLEALKEAHQGKGTRTSSVKDLMRKLEEDDV